MRTDTFIQSPNTQPFIFPSRSEFLFLIYRDEKSVIKVSVLLESTEQKRYWDKRAFMEPHVSRDRFLWREFPGGPCLSGGTQRPPSLDAHIQPLLLGGSLLLRTCVSSGLPLGAELHLPHPLLLVCKLAPVHSGRAGRDDQKRPPLQTGRWQRASLKVTPRQVDLCACPPES